MFVTIEPTMRQLNSKKIRNELRKFLLTNFKIIKEN